MDQAHGPDLRLVAVHPVAGQGLECTPESPPGCGVRADARLELRFDRYLNPSTAIRQSVAVYSGIEELWVFMRPRYDLVERVVSYRIPDGFPWLQGVRYNVRLPIPVEADDYGFRAFDGAPISEEGSVPLKFSFRTQPPECPPDQQLCGIKCVYLDGNSAHCGGCNNACTSRQSCESGSCVCLAGLENCDDSCMDTDTNNEHCGECDNACPPGFACTAGSCECKDGLVECGDDCVDLDTDPDHCGACDNACQALDVCSGGECKSTCEPGETQCGQSCVDTNTNNEHCGGCDQPCPPNHACTDGACQCEAGLTLCGDECVNTKSSVIHCGECDNLCPSPRSCEDGACSCPAGYEFCNGECVDLTADWRYCGVCDNECIGGQDCVGGGVCECPAGYDFCEPDGCVDLQTDLRHCGQCGRECIGECVNGTCPGGELPAAPPPDPVPPCADAQQVFIRGGCGAAVCHQPTASAGCPARYARAGEGEPCVGVPRMGLDLSSIQGILRTAINQVAHQTETGASSGVALENPDRFGVQMPIIDPGRPGNSYLLYKLLRHQSVWDQDRCQSRYTVELAGECPAPSHEESARLGEWFVLGEPMPLGGGLRRTDLETLQAWISAGAPTAGCE